MKSFARCFIAQTSLVAFALNEKAAGEDSGLIVDRIPGGAQSFELQ